MNETRVLDDASDNMYCYLLSCDVYLMAKLAYFIAQITLPPSALEALTRQDALSKGPLLFNLENSGVTTHSGVLEFVAEEGTVGLPHKVCRSLGFKDDVQQGEDVIVKYVRLPKAKYVRAVPASAGLSQLSELRAILEQNLRFHATLTVGDLIQVWYRGQSFCLV